jgi:hypothetical protein
MFTVVALLVLASIVLAAILCRTTDWRATIGSSFLVGAGFVAVILLVYSLLGIRWSYISLAVPALLVLVVLPIFARGKASRFRPTVVEKPTVVSRVADAGTLLVLTAYGMYATLAPPWETDFWMIWGLKARVFLETGGIDWHFLQRSDNAIFQSHYPPLLPLLYTAIELFLPVWNDRWLGVISFLFAFSVVLIVREFLQEESGSSSFGSVATLAISPAACSMWIGIAEPAFIAYATAAVLMLRRGVKRGDHGSVRLGGVLLGFSALTKDEGLGLITVVIVGFLVSRSWRRGWIAPFVAAGLAALWWVPRVMHEVSGQVFSAVDPQVAFDRVDAVMRLIVQKTPPHLALWYFAVIVALIFGYRIIPRERFLLTVVIVQLCLYASSYLVSSYHLEWHIATSWARVLTHVQLLSGVVASLAIIRKLQEAPDARGKTTRPRSLV